MTVQRIPVYEALALDIKSMGIDTVFGLMSDDTAMLVTQLDAAGVRFQRARHENAAIGMAEGYAAATGRVGVALIGRGPALTNGMHAATYAQRTGSRVLIVYGETPLNPAPNGFGPDNKAFNATVALEAAGYRPFITTSAEGARQTLADAFAAAHRQPTTLLLPTNVQTASLDPERTVPTRAPLPRPAPQAPRASAVAAAASILAKSRRPVIVAGVGAHRAGAREALIALADHLGAALATSFKAKDLFRDHPMDCGILGSYAHTAARRLVEQADCVLAFGASLNRRTTAMGTMWPKEIPVIHVDDDRTRVGRWLAADVGLVGDAKLAAEALLKALPARGAAEKEYLAPEFRDVLARFDVTRDFEPATTPRTVDSRSVGVAFDRMLPRDRNVVYDAGNFLQMVPYVSVPDPSCLKQSADFASIGMGFGVAMGFACGAPQRPTVFFVGDGALWMTLGELETVARENIPLIIVALNDCAYGAELHYLKQQRLPVGMSVFPDADFAPVAAALGFQTATVRTMQDLDALAPLLAKPDGPILIDCKVNAAVAAAFHFDGAAKPAA